jgi:ANTAR domain/GAF domain
VELDELVELSSELATLAADMRGPGDDDSALLRLTQLAVKHIDGCDWASITVLRGGKGSTLAASDDVALTADTLQYQAGEGPCLSSAEENSAHLLFDVETETRWPKFTAALTTQTPVRSVLSFQLPAEEHSALNLFAHMPAAFSDDDVTTGTVFAAQASSLVALHSAQDRAANLENALDSNREIGAAIGVLMAHHKITQQRAFTLLRQASQNLHIKLREVAAEVVDTGTLPDLPETRADGRPPG